MTSLSQGVCRITLYVEGFTRPVSFIGKYRRDLETENWHYYEVATDLCGLAGSTGTILHVRKDRIIFCSSKELVNDDKTDAV